MRFAVIGCPISHSLSPEVYAPLFTKHSIDADFIRMLVVPSELLRVRELTRGLQGFAVTMPHKRSIIPYLDRLSETASACGAVNIVEKRGEELIGHNTDGGGLADALEGAGVEISGSRALILGRGGAALAAAHALKERGAGVSLIVRGPDGRTGFDEIPAESVADLDIKADVFINATPLGMKAAGEFTRFDLLDAIKPKAVFDMVYRPQGVTALMEESRRRGLVSVDGSAMLRAQALRAFEIWFGFPA